MKRIILNSDIGEETGVDDKIMPFISWCNIACGAHAGNEKTIRNTIDLALENDVKIGAHPSYPDRGNFGRSVIDISEEDLMSSLVDQIQKVKYLTEKAGGVLHHIKPHGALYNESIKNERVAKIIIESVKNVDKSLYILTTKESFISYLNTGGFKVKHEVFADRNYNNDKTLVSRSEKNAVLTNPKKVYEHVKRMVLDHKVKTIEGEEVSIFFDTICVHGDTPGSIQILEYVYKELCNLGYVLK